MPMCEEYSSLEACFDEFICLPPEEQKKRVKEYSGKFQSLARKEGKDSFRSLIIKKIAQAQNCETLLKILQGLENIALYEKASLNKVLELVKNKTKELKPHEKDPNYIILEMLYFPNLENGR
jgi:hypothetical protein